MQHTDNDDSYDFQKELLEMLIISRFKYETEEVCLISNQPLEENHIKFAVVINLIMILYLMKLNQKNSPNHLETQRLYQMKLNVLIVELFKKGLLPSKENYECFRC